MHSRLAAKEMRDEQRNVLLALPECRQLDVNNRDAVIELLAEAAAMDGLAQVAARGRDDTNVRAHPDHLEKPRLEMQREIADLVQEEGEPATAVVEEMAFHREVADGRTVERDERPVTPWPRVVERLGDKLLAGAALTRDAHVGIALCRLRDHGVDVLHPFRLADDVRERRPRPRPRTIPARIGAARVPLVDRGRVHAASSRSAFSPRVATTAGRASPRPVNTALAVSNRMRTSSQSDICFT